MATQDRRLRLHNELVELLGSNHVYFQEPGKERMHYPCIIYHTSIGRSVNADNKVYIYTDSYDVLVIDEDPDSEIPDKVLKHFSMIRKERPYMADGLHHTPFVLFY